jgi:hypothetical protein
MAWQKCPYAGCDGELTRTPPAVLCPVAKPKPVKQKAFYPLLEASEK